MDQFSKTAKESSVTMTELVLPNDTNMFGNLMGGRLMYWMDIAAALAAMKHCGTPVVTASVDNISFENPLNWAMQFIYRQGFPALSTPPWRSI